MVTLSNQSTQRTLKRVSEVADVGVYGLKIVGGYICMHLTQSNQSTHRTLKHVSEVADVGVYGLKTGGGNWRTHEKHCP